jgi:gamma-glutamyltranspeptidase/glutathione hydrolase
VASSQPLATSAGLVVLARGGSFADAAIAMSAVLNVVEPHNSHLGGDAFLVVYDAARRDTVAFNGSGAAPRSATPESYRGGIPLRGLRAASVPGLVSTWFAFHERYGTLPVADLLAPAISYAEGGYPVGPRVAGVCRNHAALFTERPTLAALGLGPETRVGDVVRQPDLAWTLRQIADGGREAFYAGPIAERIAAHAARHAGGHFTLDDLAAHRTRVLEPIKARYRDVIVHGQPPPSQGLILLEELLIASGFDLADMDPVERTHVLVEAKKLAFADRNAFLADPEVKNVPLTGLLSESHAAARRSRIDPNRAAADHPAGDPHASGSDTTYFLVADRQGNAVSFIQSVFHAFGCAEVAEGTGVLFNNRMTGFSLDPASPNVLAPGKRPAHTLNAWLATDARTGALRHVGGTPGGHVQVQSNLQLVVNLIDGDMNPQQAIEAPRWQHQTVDSASAVDPSGPGVLEIEERVGEETVARLRSVGHEVKVIGPWAHGSSAQVLSVLSHTNDGGLVIAVGSDPRSDGQAAGL